MHPLPPQPPVITFPTGILSLEEGLLLRNRVVSALENYGCFIAQYGNLRPLRNGLFGQVPEIFAQRPRHESISIPQATTEIGIQHFITSMWPAGNIVMRQAILGYTRTAAELEEMVRRKVFEHYGIVNLPRESPSYIFRMMNYRDVGLGWPAQEFLAVLDLNQVTGLEIRRNGEWFRIDVGQSALLIMAGMPLMEWSNRRINPPELRMNEEERRYSVGLFASYA